MEQMEQNPGADSRPFLTVERIVSALIEGSADGSYDVSWHPGRTGAEWERTDVPVVAANWNEVPDGDRIQRILERRHGVDVDWSDQVDVCGDCGHVVTTEPQYWFWTPSYAWDGDCTVRCFACIEADGKRWTEGPNGYRVVDPEEWRNVSISSGTMRPEDTVPAMVAALRELGFSSGHWRAAHAEFRTWEDTETRLVSAVLNGDNTGDPDDTGGSVQWLADQLDAVAPDGCYFGAHPDDGADLGFWEVDA